jgi:FkbM family methyltransferase
MTLSALENLLVMYARQFPIRRGKLRVVNSMWRMALSKRGTHRMAKLKHGDFEMPCDLSEMLQRQFYFFGTYFLEEEILACWTAAAKDAEVIFDVGANAGIYSLAALAAQPAAVVHAFEPTPEIAGRLRTTANLNGLTTLHVHEVAVLDDDVSAVLKRFRGELGNNEGMNFVSRDIETTEAERIQAVSLDRFCQDRSIHDIDLLKIDVQGHELSVLKGAERLIATGRLKTIFMELNWARGFGGTCVADQSVRLLTRADYLFSKPGQRLNWRKAGEWLHQLSDVVAGRPSCRAISE